MTPKIDVGSGVSAGIFALRHRGGRHMKFKRITVSPKQMDGLPCIRGLRIPVATVVGMVADGMPDAEILKAFPDLEQEDIREALRFAAEAVRERELPLVNGR
jgi:uncharacterized protein (DUF433 family)